MANFEPDLDATVLDILGAIGGYSVLVSMSKTSNVALLSIVEYVKRQWIWQASLSPMTDSQWLIIENQLGEIQAELMTNIAIGSIFYSFASLSDANLVIPIGQSLAQADYEELADVVPVSWLVGTDIVLPDMRSTYVASMQNVGDIGIIIGSNTHVLTVSEMPSHNHTQNPHVHSEIMPVVTPSLGGEIPAIADLTVPTPTSTGVTTATNNPSGGDTAHNNRPLTIQAIPYLVVR